MKWLEPINRFSALLSRLDKCLMEGQHKDSFPDEFVGYIGEKRMPVVLPRKGMAPGKVPRCWLDPGSPGSHF